MKKKWITRWRRDVNAEVNEEEEEQVEEVMLMMKMKKNKWRSMEEQVEKVM